MKGLIHAVDRALKQAMAKSPARWEAERRGASPISLLVVGHPRCGTNFGADVCTALGLDIGHERMGRDGICSWMFAVDDPRNPYATDRDGRSRIGLKWLKMIQVVRDIEAAVPSVVVDTRYAPNSFEFRQKHIEVAFGVDLASATTELERAIWSIVYWNRLISEQSPDHVMRIEDGSAGLVDFLVKSGLISQPDEIPRLPPSNVAKKYTNGLWGIRPEKPVFPLEDWQALPGPTKDMVSEYCERYGYESPIHPPTP